MSITKEELKDIEPDLLYMDEFDEALMGVVQRMGETATCYNTAMIIEILMREMSYEDAVEHFEFNVANAYVGVCTPFLFTKIVPAGEEE